jgi:hypothetical protein
MTGRLMSALFLLAILALGGCQNPGRGFRFRAASWSRATNPTCRWCSRAIARNNYRWLPGFDVCASDGLSAFVQLDRPTVFAMAAPRSPIGLSCPVVESRAV